jgi:hypothetical protein
MEKIKRLRLILLVHQHEDSTFRLQAMILIDLLLHPAVRLFLSSLLLYVAPAIRSTSYTEHQLYGAPLVSCKTAQEREQHCLFGTTTNKPRNPRIQYSE